MIREVGWKKKLSCREQTGLTHLFLYILSPRSFVFLFSQLTLSFLYYFSLSPHFPFMSSLQCSFMTRHSCPSCKFWIHSWMGVNVTVFQLWWSFFCHKTFREFDSKLGCRCIQKSGCLGLEETTDCGCVSNKKNLPNNKAHYFCGATIDHTILIIWAAQLSMKQDFWWS